MIEFLVNLLPVSVFHGLVVVGLLLAIQSIIMPDFRIRVILQLLSLILLCSGVFIEGSLYQTKIWEAKVKDAEILFLQQQEQSVNLSMRLLESYQENQELMDKKAGAIQGQIMRNQRTINSDCRVSRDTIDIHNQAVQNQ